MVHVTLSGSSAVTLRLKDGRSNVLLQPGQEVFVDEKDWASLEKTGLFTIYEPMAPVENIKQKKSKGVTK
jgi:hypothetical protein